MQLIAQRADKLHSLGDIAFIHIGSVALLALSQTASAAWREPAAVVRGAACAGLQVEAPFTGLGNPEGVAVDTAGNVYVADGMNNQVLKLPAG